MAISLLLSRRRHAAAFPRILPQTTARGNPQRGSFDLPQFSVVINDSRERRETNRFTSSGPVIALIQPDASSCKSLTDWQLRF